MKTGVDTHCHLNFLKKSGDIALKCEKNKIHIIYVTSLPSQFEETFHYVKDLIYIHPSLGFHCLESGYDLEKEKSVFLNNLELTQYIGEVGLDFSNKSRQQIDFQMELFEFILEATRNKNKIFNLHSLRAEDAVLDMIVRYDVKRAIFHWYTGKIGTLKKIIDYGFYLSINKSMCTSKNGQKIINMLPKNKVLIETDAPFVKGVLPYKNQEVYEYLKTIWQVSIDDVAGIVTSNFMELQKDRNITSLF